MRNGWWLLLFVFSGVLGMPSAAAQDRTPAPKYWIFFTDKTDDAGKRLAAEPDYLTARARDRRARRGQPLSATLDAPVPVRYVASLEALGVEPLVRSRWFNAVSAHLNADMLAAVRAIPFVREVRPVARRRALPVPEVTTAPPPSSAPASKTTRLDYGPSEAQLAQINAIEPLENGINGTGVRIGFLDTEYGGFAHPAFQHLHDGRHLATENFTGQSQSNRHGMHVASVAVGFAEGELIGPGYGAEVLGATTEFAPTETHQEEDNFVAGLEWLESQGADVVNVSLGYTNGFADGNDYTPDQLDGDTGLTTRAADLAAQMGVVVVASAGNESCSSPVDCWFYVGTPADGDSVIAVGAVDSTGNRVSFSGQGPTADGRIKPDVAARGSDVYAAHHIGDGYQSPNGTSFSTPLVTGVVAQLLQVNPDLDPIEVRGILRATASQADSPDNQLGWGIVDAAAAVQEAERCRDAAVPCLGSTPTASEEETPLPDAIVVRSPFPNPFSEQAVLDVTVPAGNAFMELSVYDLLGRRVDVPFAGPLQPGRHRLVLDARDLPPGLYLYALRGDGLAHTGTLMVVR